MRNPHFIIKNDLQKSLSTGQYFSDAVTPDVLADVCYRITGINHFTYEYVDKNYSDDYLWLCENHHKLFDENLFIFNEYGEMLISDRLEKRDRRFIDESTPFKRLPDFILTDRFLEYLWHRNQAVL